MQKLFWWWQCSDRYMISLSPHLHNPSPPPFSPSLISRTVSVDVTHHVYWLQTCYFTLVLFPVTMNYSARSSFRPHPHPTLFLSIRIFISLLAYMSFVFCCNVPTTARVGAVEECHYHYLSNNDLWRNPFWQWFGDPWRDQFWQRFGDPWRDQFWLTVIRRPMAWPVLTAIRRPMAWPVLTVIRRPMAWPVLTAIGWRMSWTDVWSLSYASCLSHVSCLSYVSCLSCACVSCSSCLSWILFVLLVLFVRFVLCVLCILSVVYTPPVHRPSATARREVSPQGRACRSGLGSRWGRLRCNTRWWCTSCHWRRRNPRRPARARGWALLVSSAHSRQPLCLGRWRMSMAWPLPRTGESITQHD